MVMHSNKPKILIVDDTEANVDILLKILGSDYNTSVALSGKKALENVLIYPPDLILLDILMPEMDGYTVCEQLKKNQITKNIPVIFVTALPDAISEEKGLSLGAVDYITKPINPVLVRARIYNHLELKKYQDHLETLVYQRTIQLEKSKDAVIAGMAILAEYRDPETGYHIQRTQFYMKNLCQYVSKTNPNLLSSSLIDLMYHSAPLHDIGKVGIPDSILLKASALTNEEFELIKTHTSIGSTTIKRTEKLLGPNSFLHIAREIAESHHERWDGSGYPNNLKEEEIPLSARLMSIADVYDALISERPYKPALSHDTAVNIILYGDNKTKPNQFDPMLIEAFKNIHKEFKLIATEIKDQ